MIETAPEAHYLMVEVNASKDINCAKGNCRSIPCAFGLMCRPCADARARSQIHDGTMACNAIQAEIRANTSKISQLGSEQGAKTAQNVAAGVAGLLIWPLWFAMDFQGAATKEIAALEARNAHLGERALQTCLMLAQVNTIAPAALPIASTVGVTGLRKTHEPRIMSLERR